MIIVYFLNIPTFSRNEYIESFNKLMSARSYVFNCLDKKALKSFKKSYLFKRDGGLSTLGIFEPKGKSIQGCCSWI